MKYRNLPYLVERENWIIIMVVFSICHLFCCEDLRVINYLFND